MLLDDHDPRNPPPSLKQLVTLLGIFTAGIVLLIWLLVSLFSGLLVLLISPQLEAKLGSALIPNYESRAEKGPVQTTLNVLQDRLEAKQSDRDRRNLQVLFLPDKTINAFAIPGDRIIIFRGLLDFVESENELMMILGHEMGHFSNRDHLRGIARALGLQLLLAAFFGDTSGLQSAASLAAAISQSRFSQSQELAADRVGLSLLVKVYGHAAGATDFFDRLGKKSLGQPIPFLSTHPVPRSRVEAIEKLIKQEKYRIEEPFPLPPELRPQSPPES